MICVHKNLLSLYNSMSSRVWNSMCTFLDPAIKKYLTIKDSYTDVCGFSIFFDHAHNFLYVFNRLQKVSLPDKIILWLIFILISHSSSELLECKDSHVIL